LRWTGLIRKRVLGRSKDLAQSSVASGRGPISNKVFVGGNLSNSVLIISRSPFAKYDTVTRINETYARTFEMFLLVKLRSNVFALSFTPRRRRFFTTHHIVHLFDFLQRSIYQHYPHNQSLFSLNFVRNRQVTAMITSGTTTIQARISAV